MPNAGEGVGSDNLNARYYEGSRGQFLSQDPVFWEIGQTEDGKAVLMNPQHQNSYSYAGNNPITFKDPEGRNPLAIAIGVVLIGAADTYYSDVRDNQRNGATGYAQYQAQDKFAQRAAQSTVETTVSVFIKNPLVTAGIAGASSVSDDIQQGNKVDVIKATQNAVMAGVSDVILSPLEAVPASIRKDIATVVSEGLVNLGQKEFIKQQNSSKDSKSSERNKPK